MFFNYSSNLGKNTEKRKKEPLFEVLFNHLVTAYSRVLFPRHIRTFNLLIPCHQILHGFRCCFIFK